MYALRRFSKRLKDERFTKTEYKTSANAWMRTNHHVSKRKQAPQSEANVCRRRRQMKSRKNLPYWLHRTPNNAQNTQHKIGVAFSYLERNNCVDRLFETTWAIMLAIMLPKESCLATTFPERNDSPVLSFRLRAINMPLILLLTHTTLISSCLPSKFCSSRRQTWNELFVTFSVQMRAASYSWPVFRCSEVTRTTGASVKFPWWKSE